MKNKRKSLYETICGLPWLVRGILAIIIFPAIAVGLVLYMVIDAFAGVFDENRHDY